MKCPKCNYISFDDAERCRNCGYDFALAQAPDTPVELPLRDPDLPEGADDLPLTTPAPAPRDIDTDEWRDHEPGAGRGRVPGGVARHSAADLPLFDEPVAGVDDTPLITSPAPPRAPLAVRRSAIEPGRGRVGDKPGAPPPPAGASRQPEPVPSRPAKEPPDRPERGRSVPVAPSEHEGRARSPGAARVGSDELRRGDPSVPVGVSAPEPVGAPPGRRLVAMLIDAVIVLGIDAAVVWFTLQVVGLPLERVRVLPIAPMLLFFALLNGGYLVGFTTASGQTIGKMLTGVRVVGETTSRVPLGSAVVRAAATLLTIASLGIGYVPALSAGERRTLHDRLARTRVVRK